MLKDRSSQPVSNSWATGVCTFILDLPVINFQTVQKDNSEPHKDMSRRQLIENLGYQLRMPHIKKHQQSQSIQKHVLDVINFVISYLGNKDDNMADKEVSVDNSQNISVKPAKCHLCTVDLQGVPDKERRPHKSIDLSLNRIQQFCVAFKNQLSPGIQEQILRGISSVLFAKVKTLKTKLCKRTPIPYNNFDKSATLLKSHSKMK